MVELFRIELTGLWRVDSRLFWDGVYRVPTDLSEDLAAQAIAAGVAHRLEPQPTPAPQHRALFDGKIVVVAASGPSLTPEVAAACKGFPVIAVNDAYRLFPDAPVLYACDTLWWEQHQGVPDFAGERWSTQGTPDHNDKSSVRERFKLHLIAGRTGVGFSGDPTHVHYGQNSGFQAVNLAILWGARRVVLVGFNMQAVGGKTHFFGEHPGNLRQPSPYRDFAAEFKKAARKVPRGVEILNATPDSALTCFKRKELKDALAG